MPSIIRSRDVKGSCASFGSGTEKVATFGNRCNDTFVAGNYPHLCMEFINYVRSFYGPGGIYDMKATDEMIIDATIHYITEGGYKFCGDSFDREHVRDIMIERFGLVAV